MSELLDNTGEARISMLTSRFRVQLLMWGKKRSSPYEWFSKTEYIIGLRFRNLRAV